MKRQEYRDRIIKTLNFEQQIYKEFEQLCQEEHIYPSQKLQELMIETLQKKVVGQNPLNVSYGTPKEKSLDSKRFLIPTLDEWIIKLKEMDNIGEIGSIQGYHTRVAEKCRIRINQLKTTSF